jgi:peptidoglycan/xylan/chitin deacetylase (PgdA/CDA1 family)
LAAVRPQRFPAALMYHSVVDEGPTFRVGQRDFITQMDAIRHEPLVPLTAALQPAALRDDAIAVTFDDGYLDNYTFAIPACVERGIPVTLFVAWEPLGSSAFRGGLPMMTREHVRELAALPGVTIGSHTLTHPKLSRLSPEAQRAELEGSRKVLEDWLGRPVETFCYPFGNHDDITVALTREAGYKLAVTTKVGGMRATDAFRIPRVPVNVFSGPVFGSTMTQGYLDYARLAGKV